MPSFNKADVNTVIGGSVPSNETGQTVSSAMATGRSPGSSAHATRIKSVIGLICSRLRTSDHPTSVVDNALMVLVRSMGKIHADCITNESHSENPKGGKVDREIGRTDVDTSPSKLSQLLYGVYLGPWNHTWPQQRRERRPWMFWKHRDKQR
jgi:hypothetical protein